MGSTLEHQILVDKILLALGSRPDCRVWRQTNGVALRGGVGVSFGLKGSADITGIGPRGVRVEVEVKTGNARQTKEQKAFQGMIEKFGGVYVVARCVEDAVVAVFGTPDNSVVGVTQGS